MFRYFTMTVPREKNFYSACIWPGLELNLGPWINWSSGLPRRPCQWRWHSRRKVKPGVSFHFCVTEGKNRTGACPDKNSVTSWLVEQQIKTKSSDFCFFRKKIGSAKSGVLQRSAWLANAPPFDFQCCCCCRRYHKPLTCCSKKLTTLELCQLVGQQKEDLSFFHQVFPSLKNLFVLSAPTKQRTTHRSETK